MTNNLKKHESFINNYFVQTSTILANLHLLKFYPIIILSSFTCALIPMAELKRNIYFPSGYFPLKYCPRLTIIFSIFFFSQSAFDLDFSLQYVCFYFIDFYIPYIFFSSYFDLIEIFKLFEVYI